MSSKMYSMVPKGSPMGVREVDLDGVLQEDGYDINKFTTKKL